MAIEAFFDQQSNSISGHPPFTMEEGGFGSGQVNNVSRSNSEVGVNNSSQHTSSSRNFAFGMDRQQGSSASSMSNMQQQQQQQRRRVTDPFEMFLQLKRQQSQKLQHQMGGNGGDNGSLQSGSSMSSFNRINTLGSFANMGSLSKMSSSDMSVVLSSQDPVNGRNNQSWGNPNLGSMNGRMHSSVPAMNSSYGRMDTVTSNQSISNMSTGMNTGRNMRHNAAFGNHRSNEFMNPMMSDSMGNSFFNNNGGDQNNFPQSGGFGGGDFNNMVSPTMNPKDISKLSNEQLRQMIMMDTIGNNSGGSRMVSMDGGSNHSVKPTNKSNSEHSASSNPFLKNLGIMNYRNHVMPMTIERHSNKSRNSESDLNTTSHSSTSMDFNQSSSNFSFHGDYTGQDEYGTMPDENESYNAAANGILAPWSARAAGLFGDMMIQSTEDEKAKKASRKKPKDKPKRPLSAYNIFFKEERNRILKGEDADAEDDSVPNTISVNNILDTSTKSDVSADPIPNESRSSVSVSEDTKMDSEKGDKSKKKIGFESLAKLIGRRWQELDEERMSVYKSKASVDMERYKKEMEVWEAKHGTSSSRKRKASSSSNKKAKRGDISSSSAHTPSSPSCTSQKGLPRRNSTGGSLDLSASSQSASGKQPQHESDANASFRELNKARLGTDLFRLTEVEEDTNNGMV